MASSGVDNDTRGWIMCIVSGIACVFGATIICVDVVIRMIPGQQKFRIEESSAFLACSLSLSFGVMVFSALYSMLPSSKRYLLKSGMTEQTAGFVMMGCFIAGFVGIQFISRILHRFMPSHVVDCDHTHDGEAADHPASERGSRRPSRVRRLSQRSSSNPPVVKIATITETNGEAMESTPLLPSHSHENGRPEPPPREASTRSDGVLTLDTHHPYAPQGTKSRVASQIRRPSLRDVPKRVMSFVKDTKTNCDEYGPCFGYSDPCGQECFKHIGSRSSLTPRLPRFLRTTTGSFHHAHAAPFASVPEDVETRSVSDCVSPTYRTSRAQSRDNFPDHHDHEEMHEGDESSFCESTMSADKEAHHHHVPTNAFMNIGLQTVIAIALHKFPEGFITYATNHANPHLGFNVFMALFVHNIAEGFAMALPLYMAIGSRFKALAWSSLLGGLSQPLGAAIAVLWFHIASRGEFNIDNVAYACLFAITAGIMTSVALQLFVESLSLNHNRNLSILFAFLGMTLLGVSNALVTD